MSAYRSAGRAAYNEEDATALLALGRRVGLALDNARLFAEQRTMAEALQRSLLTDPPQPDHLDIAARYRAASDAVQVGGDWYDAFLQPASVDAERIGAGSGLASGVEAGDVHTMLVIGDVVGHDASSAAEMAQVRSLLRGIAVHSGSAPVETLQGLDRVLHALEVETTATAVVARVEHRPDRFGLDVDGAPRAVLVRWANAGHPPPVLVRADGDVVVLTDEHDADLLLGLNPHVARRQHEIVLERGDTIVLYIDGLVERRGRTIDHGISALVGLLAECGVTEGPLEGLCDRVVGSLGPSELMTTSRYWHSASAGADSPT